MEIKWSMYGLNIWREESQVFTNPYNGYGYFMHRVFIKSAPNEVIYQYFEKRPDRLGRLVGLEEKDLISAITTLEKLLCSP